MNCRIAKTVDEVRTLRNDWNRLLRAEATPFSAFCWNLEWLRAFPEAYDEILVFTFSRKGEMCAIVPLHRKGNELRFIGEPICDYQGVIATDDKTGEEAFADVVVYAMANKLAIGGPHVATGTIACCGKTLLVQAGLYEKLLRKKGARLQTGRAALHR